MMPTNPLPSGRLAVCSWSLQPAHARDLIAKLQTTGLSRIQLALDPVREQPELWGETGALCRQAGVAIVAGMFGCLGEDYSTLESIRRTGGIAPDATWNENLKNIKLAAALAAGLGLKQVTFHAGFLPHQESDPAFAKMLGRLAAVADVFAEREMVLGLETGQETAPVLLQLLRKLGRPNVGVNFDPANMILYDKGDPIEALRLLGPWVRQVHIKDARRTRTAGDWGQEVAAGTGEVNWPAFFAVLREAGFQGDLVIEREAGSQRVADIRTARAVVEKALGL
jgi:L-ribulose-5-phosphate 3-epimerase